MTFSRNQHGGVHANMSPARPRLSSFPRLKTTVTTKGSLGPDSRYTVRHAIPRRLAIIRN